MSSTNRYGRSAGMAGLAVGCGVAVWLAGWVVAGPARNPPPMDPAQPAATPANPPAQVFGALGGNQFGNPAGGFGGLGYHFAGTPAEAKAKVDELRKRYPFQSIAGRLDYEPAGAEAFAEIGPGAEGPGRDAETTGRC